MAGIYRDYYVEFDNVTKAFGQNHVLNNLSFKIPRGKISFIIGRSGEGKSVTIKHIVGLLKPDAGKIMIEGVLMSQANCQTWEKTRRKTGLLFQDGALFDSMTVFQNVAFPLQNHSTFSAKKIKDRVYELLEQVHLVNSENKMPGELSIGEKKRVGLARAIALEPSLLLYDEPTTGMDPLVADLIDKLICSTQNNIQGVTSVVISHDVTSILGIADYVFLLHQGKIYFAGTAADFKATDDPLVHQFLTGSREGPLGVPLV